MTRTRNSKEQEKVHQVVNERWANDQKINTKLRKVNIKKGKVSKGRPAGK